MKPTISHNLNNDPGYIEEGMVFTIEPILTLYPHQKLYLWDDDFTVTSFGNPSAQYEHTIIVNENGPEILTQDN